MQIIIKEITTNGKSGCEDRLTKLESGKEDLKQFALAPEKRIPDRRISIDKSPLWLEVEPAT